MEGRNDMKETLLQRAEFQKLGEQKIAVLQGEWGETLEARSKQKDNVKIRKRNLLQALRPYLTSEEKQKIDFVVKAMDMKNIMEWKEEIS